MTSTEQLQEVDKLQEYLVRIIENGTANGDDVLKILEYLVSTFLVGYCGGTGKDINEVCLSFCDSLKVHDPRCGNETQRTDAFAAMPQT